MLLQSIEKINEIVKIFNSISVAVNGPSADILNFYEKDLKKVDDELYEFTKYISHLHFLKKSIEGTKQGDYKSQVSERMKMQLINSIDITKNNINEELEKIETELIKVETTHANNILNTKNNNEIITLFNKACEKFIPMQSFLPATVIKECLDENLKKILSLNLKLILAKQRPIEIRKYEKVVDYKVSDVKKIIYPKFMRFEKIFQRCANIKYTNININDEDKELYKDKEAKWKECMAINNLLNKAIGANLEFDTIDDLYKTDSIQLLKHRKPEDSIIIFLKTKEKDFIYTLNNILDKNEIDEDNRKISGITKKYVERTNTIFPGDKSDGVFYISPLSIKKCEIVGYVDIIEQSYDFLTNMNVIIVKINEEYTFTKSGVYDNIKLIDCLELINPLMFNKGMETIRTINNYSIGKINQSIEEIANGRDRGDMNIFTPVKISNIRALVLEKLKLYKRNENKVENTDNIINILFSSIYEAIWKKTPKTKDFSDEFYITFYASINRLVFKARKDIMDRYNTMRNFESAKEVVMDVLEKMEKNILKADEMITIKYNLIV